MTRIRFKPIESRDDWEQARRWATETGRQALRPGVPTWWIRKGENILGVLQRAQAPVLGLVLAPEPPGSARDSVRILEALRHGSELEGEQPLIVTHADSVMNDLHERLLDSAGDGVRVFYFSRED